MQDLVRRLSSALGTEYNETILSSPDGLIHKASELVQVRFSGRQNVNRHMLKMYLNVSGLSINSINENGILVQQKWKDFSLVSTEVTGTGSICFRHYPNCLNKQDVCFGG